MPTPLTRQDLVAITDGAKNRIIERMVSKQDILTATETARDRLLNTINAFHVESQTLIRQASNQHDQFYRKLTAMESQLMTARQEIRMLTQAVNRLYDLHLHSADQMRTALQNEQ